MATKYKTPTLGRAYDYKTGQLVNSTIDLYNPQGGTDAELQRQWHLKQLGDIGTIWNDFTGKGVSVGVYDGGVQKAHWDLDANYDASKHVVIDGKTLDGEPVDNQDGPHGTSVAGLIAAERNGRAGVGVAYGAHVTGVNIFDPNSPIFINGSDSTKFLAAMEQGDQFDVINHSWGGGRGYLTATSRSNPDSASAMVAATFAKIAETGRGGLGTVTVMAAGNSAQLGLDNSFVTDRHAIAVAAYRQADGAASAYSNFGPHLLVSAPSNDYRYLGGTGLVTTDVMGTDGYNMSTDPTVGSDYTDSFGGTSGATPIVTGVVALMLDANENLGWRDVQNILAASAKMPVAFDTGPIAIDVIRDGERGSIVLNKTSFKLGGGDANWNGGRMHYSNDYGYGAVDAYNAVRMAEVWGLFAPAKTSANEVHTVTTVDVGLTSSSNVPFAGTVLDLYGEMTGDRVIKTFSVDDNVALERVDLTIKYSDIIHLVAGDTTVDFNTELFLAQLKLVAPDGTSASFGTLALFNDLKDADQEFTLSFTGCRFLNDQR